MTSETLLLVGREARGAREAFRVHADRLADRTGIDVEIACYAEEPGRELRDRFRDVDADVTYAVPMCAAHGYDTVDAIPAALSAIPGDVRYCDPVGTSPAVTDVIAARADAADRGAAAGNADVSLVLVAFGSSSKPHGRRMAEYHADRLRSCSEYAEVVPCYLLQNPAVECVRYAVTGDRIVAVPLFVNRSAATEDRIPTELELDRGGITYAKPFGDHPRLTDAIHAEVEKQRALATGDHDGETGDESAEESVASPLDRSSTPKRAIVTDGEGAGESSGTPNASRPEDASRSRNDDPR
ncbi:CbiX/SirB N-terminal domain-containing protein [Halopenitus persicus]|uniref:Sirohydrochlorin ferrochelatase n=1 Tax=Halopenitus persicus TaxID=1048396 RepID=A0A1H3J496_9EURY|nr:CbiX/SirB N-terminal domain-containing protein [Halopenitus persicus]SDY34813.1 Sirohydrochlorin ferrochelatase [Halopenitus persicus]